jgi:hypothetical protein
MIIAEIKAFPLRIPFKKGTEFDASAFKILDRALSLLVMTGTSQTGQQARTRPDLRVRIRDKDLNPRREANVRPHLDRDRPFGLRVSCARTR